MQLSNTRSRPSASQRFQAGHQHVPGGQQQLPVNFMIGRVLQYDGGHGLADGVDVVRGFGRADDAGQRGVRHREAHPQGAIPRALEQVRRSIRLSYASTSPSID